MASVALLRNIANRKNTQTRELEHRFHSSPSLYLSSHALHTLHTDIRQLGGLRLEAFAAGGGIHLELWDVPVHNGVPLNPTTLNPCDCLHTNKGHR